MTVQLSRISCGGGALKQIELVKNTNSETAVRVLLKNVREVQKVEDCGIVEYGDETAEADTKLNLVAQCHLQTCQKVVKSR